MSKRNAGSIKIKGHSLECDIIIIIIIKIIIIINLITISSQIAISHNLCRITHKMT